MWGQSQSKASLEVTSIIGRIGFGPAQTICFILAGGVFFIEGMELLSQSLLADHVVTELEPIGRREGTLVSVVFAGVLLGNVVGGVFSDRVGRQFPIIMSYLTIVCFSLLSSFMLSLSTYKSLRFMVGVGIGLGQPAALAMMWENTPRDWRKVTVTCPLALFGLGALFCVLLISTEDPWFKPNSDLRWRVLMQRSCILPFCLYFGSMFCLAESPVWLASNRDPAMARDVLRNMRRYNDQEDVPVVFGLKGSKECSSVEAAVTAAAAGMKPISLISTITICFASSVLGFAWYGCMYAVSQILSVTLVAGHVALAPAPVLIITYSCSLVILCCSFVKNCFASRRPNVISSLIVSAVASILFAWSVSAHRARADHQIILVLTCLGMWLGPATGFASLMTIMSGMHSVFESSTRAAACLFMARVSTIIAPICFDSIVRAAGGWEPFFGLVTLLELVSAALVWAVVDFPKDALLESSSNAGA